VATVPPIESDADLAAFFNGDEFAAEGVVSTQGGDVVVSGIIDTEADNDRPGANARSSSSPFITGAADATIQIIQYLTQFAPLSQARPDDAISITTGKYAGSYRIRDIQRDGEVCRLLLNKA
jgi:PP-loop superfamily ATP-utilizing enzyme